MDSSKLRKKIANNRTIATQRMRFCLSKGGKHREKKRKCQFPPFSPFPFDPRLGQYFFRGLKTAFIHKHSMDRCTGRLEITETMFKTSLRYSDIEDRSPVESEIVRVVSLSATEITEITRLKMRFSGSEYLKHHRINQSSFPKMLSKVLISSKDEKKKKTCGKGSVKNVCYQIESTL